MDFQELQEPLVTENEEFCLQGSLESIFVQDISPRMKGSLPVSHLDKKLILKK
jgi:hypothetical protein